MPLINHRFLRRLCLAVAFVALAGAASANPRYAGFVLDAGTGKVLYAENADAQRFPASLTKMMTLYLAFEALEAGRIKETTPVRVSRKAAAEPPSKIGLKAGSTITVRQAMQALVTKSANDAATALGELLGGSEEGFARMATAKARALGMTKTTFRNAHGLPARGQVTTARDMARLGVALREHFPGRYSLFQTRSFTYGRTVFGNHNNLLGRVQGVDGIKTGYINASGFNLVTSVRRDGRSVVAVVMGGRTAASRDAHMRDLIARTLPKASRNGPGGLVARPGGGAALVASAAGIPPKNVPVPEILKPDPVTTASLGMMPPAPPARGAQAEVAALAAAPVPPAALLEGEGSAETASEASGGGWTIQIAATPAREAAVSMLQQVQSQASGALAGAAPLVVEYQTGGQTLFRARFTGFPGKDSAWAACGAVKKHGYNCWASEG